MKTAGGVIGGVVVGLIVFAIGSGTVAAVLAALAQTDSSPSPGVNIVVGLLLDILKWGVAIWGGYRFYKYLKRKPVTAEAVKR